jgi:glycerophosphoryl diester phosphodiesterase
MKKISKFPLIIGHRGASALAPENTLIAFEKAIESGADGIEFDVQLSKDGVPFVFHDATLKRLAGINRRVTNFRADELSKIDVGSWFNEKYPQLAEAKFSRARIPTLEELFRFLAGYHGRLYLELKCDEQNFQPLVDETLRVIRKSKLLPQIVLKSFVLDSLARVREKFPSATTAALFAPKIVMMMRRQSLMIERAKKFGADEISLHYSLAKEKLVRRALREGMPTTIWTADHPKWVLRASEIGIAAIITNNPARLVAKKNELSVLETSFARAKPST